MRLRYRPEARTEVAEIVFAYNRVAVGLGERFLAALEATYGRILQFPESGEEVLPAIRRALLPQPFPYLVYYSTQAEWLEILAVVHGRRHGRVWKSRVEGEDR